ncbi:MAG: nicotinate (nicotinamide) nucleotide adenylyltransferase [Bdellovibrionota bacterium]
MKKTEITSDMRVGIFGGTFNPLHMAHMNVVTTTHSRMNLDVISVIPAAKNPLKPAVEGPSDKQRLEMLEVGFREFSDFVVVDDLEIERGGTSYTIDTVKEYAKTIPPENLYVIIGLDQFDDFDKWKDVEKLLTLTNLVVVTRPRHNLPFAESDLPKGLQPLVAAFDRQFIQLNSGRSIEFLRLQDMDISASDVRKRLRTGRNVDAQLSIVVEEYLRERELFAPIGPKIGNFEEFTRFCGNALFARKAINVRGFDLTGLEAATEYALIASGTSTRHATSLAEAVQKAVKEEYNVLPMSVEGTGEGRWVLLDYGSLIVHVFYDFVRQEYRLEDLWKNGRDLGLKDPTPAPAQR